MAFMTIMDYGLIVIFFIGVGGLTLLVARGQVQDEVASQALPPPQRAKSAYALLALLLALLIALAAVVQQERESSLVEGA